MFVIVTGLPGSGKSTLAGRLAETLELPLLSKDMIKEALWDSLGPGDREWSTRLGTAAVVALASLARSSPAAVIDHFVHADATQEWSELPRIVEVRCACPPEVARDRYATRRRHPCHFDGVKLSDSFDWWIAEDASRPPIGSRLDVDTSAPFDIQPTADWIRAAWALQ